MKWSFSPCENTSDLDSLPLGATCVKVQLHTMPDLNLPTLFGVYTVCENSFIEISHLFIFCICICISTGFIYYSSTENVTYKVVAHQVTFEPLIASSGYTSDAISIAYISTDTNTFRSSPEVWNRSKVNFVKSSNSNYFDCPNTIVFQM